VAFSALATDIHPGSSNQRRESSLLQLRQPSSPLIYFDEDIY
jgi:hypothetical protein